MWVIVPMLNYLLSNKIVLPNPLPWKFAVPLDCVWQVFSQPAVGSSI